MRKRVLLIDDCPMLRLGLGNALSRELALDVCGETNSFAEALELAKGLRPEVALMDLSLREGSGLSLIRHFKNRHRELRILVCSLLDETVFAERALRAGALCFVNKCQPVDVVVSAVRKVLAGQVYLSQTAMEHMASGIAGRRQGGRSAFASLSDREMEVFELLGRGLATSRIAKRLCLSVKTIDSHREQIKRKLGVSSSRELMCRAVQWTLHPD